MTKRKSGIIVSIALVLMICITIGLSYSYYQKTKKQTIDNVVATSCLSLTLKGENAINLENAVPISNEEGLELTPYTFTIENTCDMAVDYQVNLESLKETTLESSSIRAELNGKTKLYSEYGEGIKTIEDSKESKRLTGGVLLGKESKNYDLRLWLDKNAPMSEQGKLFASKIVITGTSARPLPVEDNGTSGGTGSGSGSGSGESGSGSGSSNEVRYAYTEPILNGTDPVIKSNLVPVTIEDDGTVRKVDRSEEWYRYEMKEWANAVILKDSYQELLTNQKVNGAIKESDGLSFDGVDDKVDLGTGSCILNAQYAFDKVVTIGIRLKFNELKLQPIIGSQNVAEIEMNADHKIVFKVKGSSGAVYEAVASNNIDTETEYTIVGTYDGNEMRLYINGALVYTKSNTEGISRSTNSFILGGNVMNGVSNTAVGSNMKVYETVIMDDYLTTSEVEKNYSGVFKMTKRKVIDYQDFVGKNYSPNEIIPDAAIDSYFVWVPRYKYKIFDEGNYVNNSGRNENKQQTIEIVFENKNTEPSTGTKKGEYLTHPAFTSFGSNGMWVSKFVAQYDYYPTGAGYDTIYNNIGSKPNQRAAINLSTASFFDLAYNYNRDLDSHMMKNTEWGAVAYLSHSKYGINGPINRNSSANRLSGYSKDPNNSNNALPYNTEVGYKASTTGNITGVYDMNGPLNTMVAAYSKKRANFQRDGVTYVDGFQGDPATIHGNKYFDIYDVSQETGAGMEYNKRILGDATGEMGPFYNNDRYGSWYGAKSIFITIASPWFIRGGLYNGGAFQFNLHSGGTWWAGTFRFVLSDHS